jgi:hypothetical protein
MCAWSSRASGPKMGASTRARAMAGSASSAAWNGWPRDWAEHEAGVALSSASGDAALAGCGSDRRGVDHRIFRARGDAEQRSWEDRHSAAAHGRRNADPRFDGHPLHRADADIKTGTSHDRSSPPRSPPADHALRVLCPGPPHGRDRLCDGDSGPAQRDRVSRLGRTAAARLHGLSDLRGACPSCNAPRQHHPSCTCSPRSNTNSSEGTECCGGCGS